MNERVLSPQLLKLVQAAGPGYSQADPAWVKTFAELIVKECAKVCLDPNHWHEDAAGETYNRAIKEHFGVE